MAERYKITNEFLKEVKSLYGAEATKYLREPFQESPRLQTWDELKLKKIFENFLEIFYI